MEGIPYLELRAVNPPNIQAVIVHMKRNGTVCHGNPISVRHDTISAMVIQLATTPTTQNQGENLEQGGRVKQPAEDNVGRAKEDGSGGRRNNMRTSKGVESWSLEQRRGATPKDGEK